MASINKARITKILSEFDGADHSLIAEKLVPVMYEELRTLARNYLRRERQGHSLQPTELVHEAYLRLVKQDRVSWKGRTHFYAVCATLMRRILVDYARARKTARRGGDRQKITLDSSLAPHESNELDTLVLHEAMERLAKLSERQARVVELRFFGGLRPGEIAEALGVSKRTVEGDWTHAKAWLRSEISRDSPE